MKDMEPIKSDLSRARSLDNSEPQPGTTRRQTANRENAMKSTGPRTAAGKKKVGVNSLKHGMLARSISLGSGRGEDIRQFEALLSELAETIQPFDCASKIADDGKEPNGSSPRSSAFCCTQALVDRQIRGNAKMLVTGTKRFEVERCVLSGLICGGAETFKKATPLFDTGCFEEKAYRTIVEAIELLVREKGGLNFILIAERIPKMQDLLTDVTVDDISYGDKLEKEAKKLLANQTQRNIKSWKHHITQIAKLRINMLHHQEQEHIRRESLPWQPH